MPADRRSWRCNEVTCGRAEVGRGLRNRDKAKVMVHRRERVGAIRALGQASTQRASKIMHQAAVRYADSRSRQHRDLEYIYSETIPKTQARQLRDVCKIPLSELSVLQKITPGNGWDLISDS